MDLTFWGVDVVAGWQARDLPVDVLCNYWVGMRERHLKQINHLNHSAALNIAAKQTKEGKSIDIKNWLPFNLEDEQKQTTLSPRVAKLAKLLRDRGELPPKMVQDLHKHKLLS